ncbi:MAG: right-handed parallel beta-helix repeat-containing protein [Ruminococcus sp.]|nr:right-handed parallel beta-helix repeat-containing protein [Ruminococcus sp.]
MMHKGKAKTAQLIAMSLALTMSLAACGESDDSSSSTAETTTTTASQAESEAEVESEEQEDSEEESATDESSEEDTSEEEAEEAEETEEVSAGVGEIEILEAASDNTELTSESVTVTIGDKSINLSGAYVVDGVDATITGGTYETSESDTNVFLVINGGSLTITGAEIIKSGDAGESDSERSSDVSDDYNFYGINSVVLCVGEDSSVTMSDCTITSESSGANAVFATDGAQIDVDNVQITTSGNSSRGVYATYEGVINADHIDISTNGAHCAPIATDRGGGYVTVTNSTVACSGDGSPCVYSTGEIVVENVIGTADGAQACVIEGKNSITMTDCTFTSTNASNGAMLYQSMSGDAADSDATSSVSTLTMTNSTITSDADGAMFYITNTSSVINLNGSNTLTTSSGQLVSAATGRWGNDGSNGGTLTINSYDDLTESIDADDISSITVNLLEGATLSGSTSGDVTVSE